MSPPFIREALLQEAVNDQVRCLTCERRCLLAHGQVGWCRTRQNWGGTLYTLIYGQIITQHVDLIEKKPLLHFYPGSTAYSIATPGCNFRCRWCQNWNISQMPRKEHLVAGREAPPERVVAAAQQAGCRSVAYTYTEPTVFFEYAYDTARLARDACLANVYVTNGYMTEEMLETFHPYLDAANVDLKAFRDETYRRYVGARLQPVLDSLKRMKALGIWLEVTTLVIPGINDDPAELRDAAQFVAHDLGTDTPWHISRFYPAHEMMDVPPTPTRTLRRARDVGLETGLRYVYVGNVPGEENTFCHHCGRLLIRRVGYRILENRVQPDGCCPHCGTLVVGVGMAGGEDSVDYER